MYSENGGPSSGSDLVAVEEKKKKLETGCGPLIVGRVSAEEREKLALSRLGHRPLGK